ncbi:MAG: hypothetical protein M3Q69_16805 [Acidobacteriota bacterium]|nr:hypothetical protein [Acidobacteriota bacterium]
MTEVVIHGKRLAKPLNRRKRVTVELPEFLVRAIKARVDEANQNEPASDEVSFNDVIEWLLVSEVTIRRMPLLEAAIPGFTAAMAVWLMDETYQAPDDEE